MPSGTCNTFTAPINLTPTKEICDLTCEFDFEYKDSYVVVENKGTFLSINYNHHKKPPVSFKGNKYFAKNILICYPSLHTFNGKSVDAEMIVTHTGEQGQDDLVVCIPIKTTDVASKSATDLEIIVNQTSYHAPDPGNTVNVNTLNINLNDFIPRKPYYYYSGTFQFNNCSKKNHVIVFDYLEKAYITMTTETGETLEKILSPQEYTVNKKNKNFFYNRIGPVEAMKNDIYIDCQPTGDDGEVLIATSKAPGDANIITKELKHLQKSPLFNSLLGILLMVGLYNLGRLIFSRISSDRPQVKK